MKEAEEAQLAKIEEERVAEEERKRKEEEEQRQPEEQKQAAIVLAKYQKNTERAEAERIETAKAAFKKREDADVELHKATAKVQREAKAKVRKEEAAVKKAESEKTEGSKKRGREEREISMTIRSFLMEHGVGWKGWSASHARRGKRSASGGWRLGGVVNIPIYSLSLLLFIVSITFSDIVLTLII